MIDFVGLSLLCSPISDEADFETTLESSLVVADHQEEMPKNVECLLMTFAGMSVFDVIFPFK